MKNFLSLFLTFNLSFFSFIYHHHYHHPFTPSHLYFMQPTKQIEKLNLRRMLSNYRNVNAAKTAPILSGHHNKNSENPQQQQPSTKSHHHHNNNKEHGKNQPILPEVGQYVYDSKTGKKYMRGKLMGKVRPLFTF